MPCERTAMCNIFCDSQLVPSGRDWIFLTRKSAKASQWHSFYLSNPTLSLGVLQASGGLQSWALELEREFTFFFLRWSPEWEFFILEENYLLSLSNSHALWSHTATGTVTGWSKELKRIKRGLMNFQLLPSHPSGFCAIESELPLLNTLSFTQTNLLHSYEELLNPQKSVVLSKFYTRHLRCHGNAKKLCLRDISRTA